jgi:hypothetical protein
LAAGAGLAAGGWLAKGVAQEVRFVRIGTGATGGAYFPIGGLIANAISNPPGSMACEFGGSCGVPGLIAAAVSTQGSVQNASAVANATMDLALCQADVAFHAFSGTGKFAAKPLANLRVVASLYPKHLHVVVRRDAEISSLRGLRQKRINLGEPDSGTLVATQLVLEAFGVAVKSLRPSYESLNRATSALVDGRIDGLFMMGGLPLPAVAQAADSTALALLHVAGPTAAELTKGHPYFTASEIPAGTYRDVPAVETLAVTAQLIAAATMSDDLVYEITRALWHPRNRRILDGGHPNGRLIRLETATVGLSIPLHSGAARFYAEAGVSSGTTAR